MAGPGGGVTHSLGEAGGAYALHWQLTAGRCNASAFSVLPHGHVRMCCMKAECWHRCIDQR